MKVLFLTAYSELAASSRTRVYDYLPFLQSKGIRCKVICFTPSYLHGLTSKHQGLISKFVYYLMTFLIKIIDIISVIFYASSYDIIFIQKIIFPFGLEKIIKFLNKNIIFDFDDAIFTGEDGESSLFNKIKYNFQQKGFENMLKISRCCLVENNYNRNIALKYCPWVEVITGPIDTERYFIKEKNNNFKVVLGWTGSQSTAKYLIEIKDVLKNLSKKYDIILRLVGVGKNFKIDGLNFETKEWSLKNEVSYIQTFDIGIMPLPDNKWTRGKGGYKLLQYMACGIPAVASPVEINKEIVKNGINGFLAGNLRDWEEKISTLIENEDLRKKMGGLARTTMEQSYSLVTASEKILNIFDRLQFKNGK